MNLEEYESALDHYKVPFEKLRPEFNPEQFSFETTADLEKISNGMIGQERAEQSMDFGLSVEQKGYNLFVVGPAGTGKTTYTLSRVKEAAKKEAVPNDLCYVYNFENPDRPIILEFSPGEGINFQRRMEILLIDIQRELKTVFTEESTEKKKRAVVEFYQEKVDDIWNEAKEFASQLEFRLEQTPGGIQSYPLIDGRPMETKEFEQLSDQNKEELHQKEKQIENKVSETLGKINKIQDELRKALDKFLKETAANAIQGLFQSIRERYTNNEKVLTYLEQYFHDVINHYTLFLSSQEEKQNNELLKVLSGHQEQFQRYKVNLFVNHRTQIHAPVIYETNPTYQNLFGKIEYRGSFGSWVTDFTHIKPGALHLANGGYLILQASQLLEKPFSWTLLKRALQTGQVQIENPAEDRSIFPTSGLKPEPIPLKLKVIIIGSYYLYNLLSSLDEEFNKLFKVKVEFETIMDKNEKNCLKMGHFVKNFAEENKLLPFHRSAVASIIDYSSRLVEEQNKMTTRFQEITKILVESSYWAKNAGEEVVTANHIKKAIIEQRMRTNHVAEQYRELIKSGRIMVETDGDRIGQINGLAVIGTRDMKFGIPTKITARTFVGKSGIMNIERETALSGQIHNKGILILIGFLSGTFAQTQPIPLSASITFEQTYSPVDGDSASSTELYALISSLAEVPIHQGIAVTGSVNQWGEVQPIGGVNEKIEGFYYVCKEHGLTGRQGVIIPEQNVSNLMLDEEVTDAVREGKFHIWKVSHISEGLEILTGEKSGYVKDENGKFPEGTIFGKVQARFNKMFKSMKKEQKNES